MSQNGAMGPLQDGRAKDLASSLRGSALTWGVPIAALVGTGVLAPNSIIQLVVWPITLAWMGGACLY